MTGQLPTPVGVYSWMATAGDLGLDLDTAVHLPTFEHLDAVCCDAGVIGGTYATGDKIAPRAAYAVIDGRQYVAPAVWDMGRCSWPNPGAPAPYDRGAREADHAEDRATRAYYDTGVLHP